MYIYYVNIPINIYKNFHSRNRTEPLIIRHFLLFQIFSLKMCNFLFSLFVFLYFLRDLSRQSHWLTLSFRDSAQETEFTRHKDAYAGIYYGACPCALVAVALSAFSVISFTIIGLVVLLVGLVFLALITTFSACETSPMKSRLKVNQIKIYTSYIQLR